MRILHVITTLFTGGAEKLMVDLLPRLKSMGDEVELCVFLNKRTPFYEALEKDGIKIFPLSVSNVYNPINLLRLYKVISKGKYDVVHTHNTACQLYSAVTSILCKTLYVTTEHNTSNRRRGNMFLSYFDRWMYNRYNHVICISKKTEENLKAFIGSTRADISTIHNGIDVSVFQNAQPIEKKTERFVITMVGAFRPQKDQDTIVRAMQHLDKEKFEVWLVGDGERRKVVESWVNSLGLQKNIKFLGIRSDIPSVLKASDVVVMSSHWEGFGLAAAEGMAAGKPVIASNVDGLAQVVGEAGILFEPGNELELAQKIELLASDSEYCKTIAAKCSTRAMDFDISKMVKGYERVYRKLEIFET